MNCCGIFIHRVKRNCYDQFNKELNSQQLGRRCGRDFRAKKEEVGDELRGAQEDAIKIWNESDTQNGREVKVMR